MLYLLVISVFSILCVWSLYNAAILGIGVRHLRRVGKKDMASVGGKRGDFPFFSVIVPVKDEEKVIGRLLESLSALDYPSEKWEVVLVEDGSTDMTTKMCAEYVTAHPNQARLVHKTTSNGKPSALNCGLEHVRGEIVAVFDADSVLEPEILLKAAPHFENPSTVAVQGRPCSINADENILSKFISYEEAVRYEVYTRGKDTLDLFVPLTGSCYFIRKRVLETVGGWDNSSLSEDMELSSRLVEDGYGIRYASDVRSWQENPTSLGQLFGQRVRWFRGCMEVSLKYGRLLRKVNRRGIDAEITLAGPFMFVPFLLGYALGVNELLDSVHLDFFSSAMSQGMMLLSTVTLFLIGAALFYLSKPRKIGNLLWLPFVYAYLSVQSFIALYALIQIVLRRPRKWLKTSKSGTVTNYAV